jgi:pyridoxal phosphate enzyme (YggS family)
LQTRTANLRDNIARVQDNIAKAAISAGRDPGDVKLVAVTKTYTAEQVAEAARLGLRHFGENRVQEAADKLPRVRELVNLPLEWHLVGTLQRNKVKNALGLFAILQSVDSVRLAEAIDRRAGESRVPVLLEVYLGDEPDRPGFRPRELVQQLPAVMGLPRLELRGLMTVAPLGLDKSSNRSVFARLRDLRDQLVAEQPGVQLRDLSMGMTDDYPLAIAEGATIVRIGRAIFGERPSR